jgi:hypothetical protein
MKVKIKYKIPIVNFPDYQTRICKNLPTITWKERLHERLSGHKTFAYLPKEESFALYHHKTIEKQIQTNLNYNKNFTDKENRGIHNND